MIAQFTRAGCRTVLRDNVRNQSAVLVLIFITINSEIGISFRKPLSLSSRTKHSNTPFTVSSPMVDLFVLADLVSSSSIKRFLMKEDETTLRTSMRKIGGFQRLREI